MTGLPEDFDWTEHNYECTLTCFEVGERLDLRSNEAWKAATNQVASENAVHSVYHGYDVDRPQLLIVLINWQQGTSLDVQTAIAEAAWAKVTSLFRRVNNYHLVFRWRRIQDCASWELQEFYIIQGDQTIVKPNLLEYVSCLQEDTTPDFGDELPEELTSATMGITGVDSSKQRTMSFVLHFVNRTGKERLCFKSPDQDSRGGAKCYENLIAKPLQEWKAQGATTTMFTVQLRRWSPDL